MSCFITDRSGRGEKAKQSAPYACTIEFPHVVERRPDTKATRQPLLDTSAQDDALGLGPALLSLGQCAPAFAGEGGEESSF